MADLDDMIINKDIPTSPAWDDPSFRPKTGAPLNNAIFDLL